MKRLWLTRIRRDERLAGGCYATLKCAGSEYFLESICLQGHWNKVEQQKIKSISPLIPSCFKWGLKQSESRLVKCERSSLLQHLQIKKK